MPRSAWRAGLLWLSCFTAVAVWAFTIPVAASGDQRQHVAWAAAVVRGQLVPPERVVDTPDLHVVESLVTVPRGYAITDERVACFSRDPARRAICTPGWGRGDEPTTVATIAGRYPPLYYAAVGWPSLLAEAHLGVRLMRLASAVLIATLMWLALRRRSDVAVGLVALALTPRLLQLSSLVNPQALEIVGALLLWISLVARDDGSSRSNVGVVAGGISVLVARPVGPVLFVSVGVLALVATTGARPSELRVMFERLTRSPRDRIRGGLLGAVAIGSVAWMLLRDPSGQIAGRPDPSVTTSDVIGRYVAEYLDELRGMVWLGPPRIAWTWVVVVGVLVLAGIVAGRWRERVAMLGVVAWSFLVPIVGIISNLDRVGYVWQGRYAMAVIVGLVIIASVVVSRERPRVAGPMSVLVVGVAAGVHTFAVHENLTSRVAAVGDVAAPLVPALVLTVLTGVAWTIPMLTARRREPAEPIGK